MDKIRDAVRLFNPGQVPVITADQPIYAKAKQIQWQWPEDYGESQFLIMFGGLHIEMTVAFTWFLPSRQWEGRSSYWGGGSFNRHSRFFPISCECHQDPSSPPGDSVQPLQAPEISLLYIICGRIGWPHSRQEFWRLVLTPQTTESTVTVLAFCVDNGISCSAIHQVSERIQLQSLPSGLMSADTIHVCK